VVTTLHIQVQRTGAQDIGEVIKRGGTRTKNHIDNSRWVIMPNWIDYLDTDALVPVEVGVCVEPLVVGDGVVVVLGR
jgi:hypothetical protein